MWRPNAVIHSRLKSGEFSELINSISILSVSLLVVVSSSGSPVAAEEINSTAERSPDSEILKVSPSSTRKSEFAAKKQ